MTGFRIKMISVRMSPRMMWLLWRLCLGNLLRKSLLLNCLLDRGIYYCTIIYKVLESLFYEFPLAIYKCGFLNFHKTS